MSRLHKSEGDINISPRREKWQKGHIDAESRSLLDEDAHYFLKQSFSTPCLNTMRACEGIYIEDMQGRRYMDFHGNNVHQVGFANPVSSTPSKTSWMSFHFAPAVIPTAWPLSWPKNWPISLPEILTSPYSAREGRKPSEWH